MALSFAKGTARFISGSIGKMKKENIKLKTNTATIGIRGTDFTVTVDELDRTLVILLPDKNGESSGEITVTNEGGTVTLNQAFQATIVSTISSPPASPVQIENITVAQIDNLFIVSPPEEIQQVQEEARTENSSNNILTADFLEFNELEKDYLEEEKDWSFSELDINLLDVDFLQDLLLIIEESDLLSRKSAEGFDGIMIEGTQPGLDPDTQYNTIIEDTGFIWFYRQVNGIISIRIPIDSNAYINTVTDQKESIITVGDGTSAMKPSKNIYKNYICRATSSVLLLVNLLISKVLKNAVNKISVNNNLNSKILHICYVNSNFREIKNLCDSNDKMVRRE